MQPHAASAAFLASPPGPRPPAHPTFGCHPLLLGSTSLWFGSVLFVIIFFFIFSFPSFVSPSPPLAHPASLPRPHVLPPPIEPSAPPQDVKCVSTRSTAILVSWRPPPPDTHNGALVSYSVRYRPLGSEDPQPKEVNGIPPTTTQILLEALDKWTTYRITTVAHTEVGPGPESSPVVIRTDEDGKHRGPRRPQPGPPPRSPPCLENQAGWWSPGRGPCHERGTRGEQRPPVLDLGILRPPAAGWHFLLGPCARRAKLAALCGNCGNGVSETAGSIGSKIRP